MPYFSCQRTPEYWVLGAIIQPDTPLEISECDCFKCFEGALCTETQWTCDNCTVSYKSTHGHQIDDKSFFEYYYPVHSPLCDKEPINNFSWITQPGCTDNATCNRLVRGDILVLKVYTVMGDSVADRQPDDLDREDFQTLRRIIDNHEPSPGESIVQNIISNVSTCSNNSSYLDVMAVSFILGGLFGGIIGSSIVFYFFTRIF